MFVRNAWYVAATSQEVGRTPFQRQVCCDPIVFYRTQGGRPVALADRCIHRRMPLSKGRLVGDTIQCGYHGFVYDGGGKCIQVPGQENVPARARVHAYPLVEQYGWIWLWMGDIAKADPALLPKMPGLDETGWVPFRDRLHVKAHYQLLVDNLLDLSHESYVHNSSIGDDKVAHAPIQSRRECDEVFVDRVMRDLPPPPFFAEAARSTSNIDRYQLVHFQPPCYVHVEARTVPPGSDNPNAGVRFFVLDALTPETESSTNYFWAVARNFRLDDEKFHDWWHDAVCSIFQEDRAVLEAQQASIETDRSGMRVVDVKIDSGTVLAHQVVDELIAREAAARV